MFIEIHPSMEDFDDFERVRFLAQDQEMRPLAVTGETGGISDSLHQELATPRSRADPRGKRLDPRRQLRGIGIGLRLTEFLDRIFEYVGKPGESGGSVDDRLHLLPSRRLTSIRTPPRTSDRKTHV